MHGFINPFTIYHFHLIKSFDMLMFGWLFLQVKAIAKEDLNLQYFIND